MFVNQNFGCGSSREHAPQSLMRWGIKAIIGESFAEIFYGNCTSLGIPCITLGQENIQKIMKLNQENPNMPWKLDLEQQLLQNDQIEIPVTINPNSQQQFLSGKWNPLTELTENMSKVHETAKNIPYFTH